MKKFLLILFLILNIIPKVALAFEPPDPNRWFWAGSDDKIGVWIDMRTLKFHKEYNRYSACQGHRFVTAWEIWYDARKNLNTTKNAEYDLDCRKLRYLSSYTYNDNGNVISSTTIPGYYFDVVPGSWGETLMDYMNLFWNVSHDKNLN